jgi:hypothetical protein
MLEAESCKPVTIAALVGAATQGVARHQSKCRAPSTAGAPRCSRRATTSQSRCDALHRRIAQRFKKDAAGNMLAA